MSWMQLIQAANVLPEYYYLFQLVLRRYSFFIDTEV